MPKLINSLYLLSKQADGKGWVDISIKASALARELEEKGYKDKKEYRTPRQPTPVEMFGTTFPPMDLLLEAHVESLRFKFEVEHVNHVPTLFIHSKEPIEDDDFDAIQLELQDVSLETASIEQVSPFLLIETHTYCVNLNDHMNLIYGVLCNVMYGEYLNPDENEEDNEEPGSSEMDEFGPNIY